MSAILQVMRADLTSVPWSSVATLHGPGLLGRHPLHNLIGSECHLGGARS